MAAAREKASLYAEAAGARLGPVIHIQEVGSDQVQRAFPGNSQAAPGRRRGDLTPGKITVTAGVAIGFSLIGG